MLQANTVIASEASSRMDAFTDVEVNLSGEAARTAEPCAGVPSANGHATEVMVMPLYDIEPLEALPAEVSFILRHKVYRLSAPVFADKSIPKVVVQQCLGDDGIGTLQGVTELACVQVNGHPSPRSASKRAPAPMPALAKRALSENGISPRPLANGRSSSAKKGDSADAWSEAQDMALVQVGFSAASDLQKCDAPYPSLHLHAQMQDGSVPESGSCARADPRELIGALASCLYEIGNCVCRR